MYADDKYKIVGTISIPEEKREEFNRNVEKVLDVFGIRQTEKRMVGDREITVLKKPEADEDGIVRFNYSMFEKRVREGDSYNTKTCQLICPDRGWDEFGVAMNSILIMQEAYSETPCFLRCDDRGHDRGKAGLSSQGKDPGCSGIPEAEGRVPGCG